MEDIKLIKGFFDTLDTAALFVELETGITWRDILTSTIDGSQVKINRKMAYVYDTKVNYKYANLMFMGETWEKFPELITCLMDINDWYGFGFNSVLLNYYRDGRDEIKWHSDKEEIIGLNPIIACVNLGATRKFWFRRKEAKSEKFFETVENGDLLIMGENCQANYLHAILPEKDVKEPRISLTFRKVVL